MYKIVIMMMLMLNASYAKAGIDIAKIIKSSFSDSVTISPSQFKLKPLEIKQVQKNAKARIDSNLIRMYTVRANEKIEGYAIIIVQKVRTKKAAILYIIDKNEKIKSIEILAFNEPSEYKPNEAWKSVFEGKSKVDNLFSGKGIPTISGATLSARAISDASRIALSILELYK